MEIEEKVYIWLSMTDMPINKLYDLVNSYSHLEDLWNVTHYDSHIMQYLDGSEFQELMNIRANGRLERTIEKLSTSRIKYITIDSPEYPEQLKSLDMPPLIIYYIGDISLLKSRCFAIVGSRICTRYGKEQTERFAQSISRAGFTIVSGLAEGIDGHAHEGVMKIKGKAIGVLAGGLDYIFPAINVQLARDVVNNGGLIISEKAPDVEAKRYTFVQRNRIIAGLSEGVLVTEAGKDSGALYTINFALDAGKDIFALPGNCNSLASEGSNFLIKQFYSCCVTKPEEIITTLNNNFEMKNLTHEQTKLDVKLTLKPEELQILEFVRTEDKHFDEILEKTQLDAKKLIGLLTTMEIRGLINKLPSNFYGIKD